MASPFMQFWVGDYLRDTQGLSCEGHGAYLLILMALWNADGSLPNEDKVLARIARCSPVRWRHIRADVMAFLTVENGRVTQTRLVKELKSASEKRFKNRVSGSLGGRAKALKNNVENVANAKITPQQPEPESESKKKVVEAAPPAATPPKQKAATGSRWPSDQEVPTEWLFWARERFSVMGRAPPDLAVEAVKFANFWAAKTGKDATKVDWKKTFLNWCLNARSSDKGQSPHNNLNTGTANYLRKLESEARGQGQDSDIADKTGQLLLAP